MKFDLFQDMTSAVITPCSHFFHAGCLKKWLYVQETCPLCHSQLKSQSPTNAGATQETPAANQNPAGQEEAPGNKQEEDHSTLPEDRKEEASVEQEGDNETTTSAGEASSSTSPTSMQSAPLHIVNPPLSSSSCSSSPLATDSVPHQSPADHPSASSFSTSCTSDTPDAPASHRHSVSTFRQPTSQVLTQAEANPAEPESLPQLKSVSLVDSKENSTGPSSQSNPPTPHSVEPPPRPPPPPPFNP